MTSKATTVAEYLQELPPERRAALETLRALIHRVAPGASEGIDYGMPVFKDVCALASQKHYMALYVCDTDLVESYRSRLGKLDIGKSCIRFRHLKDLPIEVVESLLKEVVKRHAPGGGSKK